MAYMVPYPNYYSQQQTQPQSMPTQNNSNLIWVQGEAGAKSYLVAPNTTVQLWDSEKQVIYLKSADASGMPSMKILDYTIRGNESETKTPLMNSENDYATKDDIYELREQLEDVRKEIRSIPRNKTRRKEVEDDE